MGRARGCVYVCMCVCVREARGRCVYVLCVGEALVLARLVQGAVKKQVCVCCFYVWERDPAFTHVVSGTAEERVCVRDRDRAWHSSFVRVTWQIRVWGHDMSDSNMGTWHIWFECGDVMCRIRMWGHGSCIHARVWREYTWMWILMYLCVCIYMYIYICICIHKYTRVWRQHTLIL